MKKIVLILGIVLTTLIIGCEIGDTCDCWIPTKGGGHMCIEEEDCEEFAANPEEDCPCIPH